MTETQLTYRLYEPGDEIGICRVFEDVFKKHMSPEHWRWKYQNGFFGEALNMVALNPEGEVVGHFGAQPLPFQHGGVSYRTAQLMDGMIKNEYRSKGLYLELCRKFFQICDDAGIQLLFGFPSERMAYVVCLGGFFLRDTIYRFTKFLDPSLATKRPLADLVSAFSARSFVGVTADAVPAPSGVSERSKGLLPVSWKALGEQMIRFLFRAEETPAGDPRVARVWEEFRTSCPCGLDRTKEYLHWRFDLHPDFRYLKVAVFWRWGRTPLSCWVARIDGKMAYLLEGFSRFPLNFLWSAGLEKLEVFLARLGVSEVAAILPEWHPTSHLLRKHGYETRPEGRLTTRLGPGISKEVTEGWYYTYGDHDDF